MKPINARTHTSRGVDGRGATRAQTRQVGRIEAAYGAFIDGSNALQLGHDDVGVEDRGVAGHRLDSTVATPDRSGEPAQPVVPRQRTVRLAAPVPVAVPRAPFLIGVVTIVAVGVLGVLLLNTKINENSFQLDNLQATQASLDLEEQKLAQALAERESTGNLRAAATRLGLVPAENPAFLRLPDGQVTGVPQPAGRGEADPGR